MGLNFTHIVPIFVCKPILINLTEQIPIQISCTIIRVDREKYINKLFFTRMHTPNFTENFKIV